MSKRTKWILGLGVPCAAVVAALLLLPVLLGDRIEERIRAEIEQATELSVGWSEADVGLLRQFPHLTLSLREATVATVPDPSVDTIVRVERFDVAIGAWSVVRAVRGSGPLEVRRVRVAQPTVRLVRSAPEPTDSTEPEEESTPPPIGAGASLSLRSLEVTGGDFLVQDSHSGLFLATEGFDLTLAGDFSREILTARMQSRAEAMTLRFAGAPYLNGVTMSLETELDVSMVDRVADIASSEVSLNALTVALAGTVAEEDGQVELDLSATAPHTDFDALLSLLPPVQVAELGDFQTAGRFSLAGTVQGAYGPAAFPAFTLDVEVVDGSFRAPGAEVAADAIAADLSVSNPGGAPDSTVLTLRRFHVEVDDQPFDATLVLRTPLSDPAIDLTARGTVDVGRLSEALGQPAEGAPSGVIVADASVRARRSDVAAERFDSMEAEGVIEARGVTLPAGRLPHPVEVRHAELRLNPGAAELRDLDVQLGSSDLRASGVVQNVLGFVLDEQSLSARGRFESGFADLDEWRSDDALATVPVPPRLDVTLDGSIDRLRFSGIDMANARGRAIVRDQRVVFEGFRLEALGGEVSVNGHYETVDPTRPTFALTLSVDTMDIAGAAGALRSVRTFVPVSRFARGSFSSLMTVSGEVGPEMEPVLEVLDGDGSFSTSQVQVVDFPLLDRMSESLRLSTLTDPTIGTLRSTARIEDGRLVVAPFDAAMAGYRFSAGGSHGIDQTMDYTVAIDVPRSSFGGATLTGLATRAGPLGTRLAAADPVRVSVGVGGTVDNPTLDLGLANAAGTARASGERVVEAAVDAEAAAARARADSAAVAARRRAVAEADSLLAQAERLAADVRSEARRAADQVRAEGDRAADELLARATNPIARRAAEPAADRLRQAAEDRAATIEREAEVRATEILEEARRRSDALRGGVG